MNERRQERAPLTPLLGGSAPGGLLIDPSRNGQSRGGGGTADWWVLARVAILDSEGRQLGGVGRCVRQGRLGVGEKIEQTFDVMGLGELHLVCHQHRLEGLLHRLLSVEGYRLPEFGALCKEGIAGEQSVLALASQPAERARTSESGGFIEHHAIAASRVGDAADEILRLFEARRGYDEHVQGMA
jgi:hypothetical protein